MKKIIVSVTAGFWAASVAAPAGADVTFEPRGRIQYDIQSSEWDTLDEDDTQGYVRRAFIGAQGDLTERWSYKVDVVVTPADDWGGVDDAYLQYDGGGWQLIIGEAKVTAPLEDRISSLDIPFVERSSVINAFGYGRRGGVSFITGADRWHWSVAVQGDSLNDSDDGLANEEGLALSSRLTWAPILNTGPDGLTLVHLGAHVRQRESGDDGVFRYRTRPLNGRDTRWIDAGGGLPGDEDISYGVELAVQRGAFGAQAEYITLDGETAAGVEYDFDGYYVDLHWSITGESRRYRGNRGAFSAIAPANPVTSGGPGHWMVSARYDHVDLSDPAGGAARGEQSAYALGLDWVPVQHVRFKLNYALSDMDRTIGPDDEAQIITLRTQFDF